jgi:hypothetical protein
LSHLFFILNVATVAGNGCCVTLRQRIFQVGYRPLLAP